MIWTLIKRTRNIISQIWWNSLNLGLESDMPWHIFFSKPLSRRFCICFGLNFVSGSIVRKRQEILEWSRLMMHNKRPSSDRTCVVWEETRCKTADTVNSEDHFDGPLQDQTGEIHESNSHLWKGIINWRQAWIRARWLKVWSCLSACAASTSTLTCQLHTTDVVLNVNSSRSFLFWGVINSPGIREPWTMMQRDIP